MNKKVTKWRSQQHARISTNELADLLCLKPQTIRRSLCMKGHYLEIRPTKLANGRLLWPIKETLELLGG